MGMEIWLMNPAFLSSAERATERVAVLSTPAEKATFADRANCMGPRSGNFEVVLDSALVEIRAALLL